MLDADDLEPTKLVRARGSRPFSEAPRPRECDDDRVDGLLIASDEAATMAMARFRRVEPGGSLVQSWPADLGVTIVMLSGKLALVTGDASLVMRRDDVVALGSQRGYAVGNHPSTDQGSTFVEFWTRRRDTPRSELEHHTTVDRHERIRTFVELVPPRAAGPRVASVILYPGDVVTYELAMPRAYAVSTVGTVTINGLDVLPRSAAMIHGPGRATIRAFDSTEVLLAGLASPPRVARRLAA